ncbi:MAG: putative endopeptidase, partial [Candidatus Marinamargulisbacteria bacterium]
AFQNYQSDHPLPVIDGFSPDQRFFLGYAKSWCTKHTDKATELRMKTDVHALAHFRVLGPLPNMPEFYAAFNIEPSDAMWRDPADRIQIW